jgi:hypothetical protein
MMHNSAGFIEKQYSQVLLLVQSLHLNILIAKARMSLFSTVSRPALEPTKPPIQWTHGVLFTRVKWLGYADHMPLSSNKDKNECSSTQML